MFYCNDTAPTEIYTYLHTLSLHDALPISSHHPGDVVARQLRLLVQDGEAVDGDAGPVGGGAREGGRADRKSTRLTSSHSCAARMPSSACKKKNTKPTTSRNYGIYY